MPPVGWWYSHPEEEEDEDMRDITVRKSELLERLMQNRAKHREVFEAAIEGFRKQAIKHLNQLVRELKAGQAPSLYIDLPVPQDHTKDYDRVIEMVRMHTEDTINLSEADAGQYIMDQWNWKGKFTEDSSIYAAAAVTRNYG